MILGVDPGLASCGWAIVAEDKSLVACGCFKTKPSLEFSERLYKIYNRMRGLCRQYKIKKMSVEALFFAKNTKTALKVAQALGVIKAAAKESGADVFEYTPLQIKIALTGYGRAEKEQVIAMIKQTLKNHEEITNDHAADAAGAALTHLFSAGKEVLK